LDEIWYADAESHSHMPMTTETSKWKPEVEFQYGGCLVSENGNSNFSATDCATFSKVIVQIDFGVLNCDSSPKRKPEVDLRRCGRHNGYAS